MLLTAHINTSPRNFIDRYRHDEDAHARPRWIDLVDGGLDYLSLAVRQQLVAQRVLVNVIDGELNPKLLESFARAESRLFGAVTSQLASPSWMANDIWNGISDLLAGNRSRGRVVLDAFGRCVSQR